MQLVAVEALPLQHAWVECLVSGVSSGQHLRRAGWHSVRTAANGSSRHDVAACE
jgi:hypothetical protein